MSTERRELPHLAWVALGSLFPLPWALAGALDLPLLISCYVAEAVAVPLAVGLATPGSLRERIEAAGALGAVFAFSALIVGFGAVVSTAWSPTSLLVLAACTGAGLGATLGPAVRARLRGEPGVPVRLDVLRWLGDLGLIALGALVAVPYVEALAHLEQVGWVPGHLTDTPMSWAGQRFNAAVEATGLAASAAGAVLFVAVRCVNEVGTALRARL